MTNSRSAASWVTACCLLSAGALPAADLQRFEAVQPHMGTLVRIQLYAPDAGRANVGFHAAFERIAQVDAALSDYRADSKASRLCVSAVGKPVSIGPDLLNVLAASLLVADGDGAHRSRTTGGARIFIVD